MLTFLLLATQCYSMLIGLREVRASAILRFLKNSLVHIISKRHLKPCYCLYYSCMMKMYGEEMNEKKIIYIKQID